MVWVLYFVNDSCKTRWCLICIMELQLEVLYLSFSHGGNDQELLHQDTILDWKVLETMVSVASISIVHMDSLCLSLSLFLSFAFSLISRKLDLLILLFYWHANTPIWFLHWWKAIVGIVVVTVVGTAVGIVDVMTMDIGDLQGVHHIENVVIILQDIRPMVEGQGGTGPGHCLILLARKGSMLVVLGDAVRLWYPLRREGELEVCEPIMVL